MKNIIKKAQKGDDDAFLMLFKCYEQDIYRMAFIYMKNQNDALDIVQETAYRAFKAIAQLKDHRYVKTWLIKIAINCSLDLLRQQQKNVLIQQQFSEKYTDFTEDNLALQITLHDLMNVLNEGEKSVIILKYYEDLTFKEIAETLNIPLGTAKTILYKALQKLRQNAKGDEWYEA